MSIRWKLVILFVSFTLIIFVLQLIEKDDRLYVRKIGLEKDELVNNYTFEISPKNNYYVYYDKLPDELVQQLNNATELQDFIVLLDKFQLTVGINGYLTAIEQGL